MGVKTIIDLDQARANRRRAELRAVDGADFLFRAVVEDLALRLTAVTRDFEKGLLLVPAGAPGLAAPFSGFDRVAMPTVGNGEALGLEAGRYDIVASLLTLHEVNDVPGVLAQIRRALKPDGLFMACIPGAETLHELRDSLLAAEVELTGAANARVLPFIDVRDAGGLLQRAGFALPVADAETIVVRYDTMFDLMSDLRAMGATNTLVSRSRKFASLELFRSAAEHYALNHADADGRIRASFSFVWMSGWVPHESQQKPLKPGSAAHRLADFIGDKSDGDKG